MKVLHFCSNHKGVGIWQQWVQYFVHREVVIFEFETFEIKSLNLRELLDQGC